MPLSDCPYAAAFWLAKTMGYPSKAQGKKHEQLEQ